MQVCLAARVFTAEWVWENLGEARCPPAPNRKARELWRYAKRNRDGFLDKYVPLLVRAENDDPQGRDGEEGEDNFLDTCDRMLNEMGHGDPPHDWRKDYQDARNCPMHDECPALKAAIAQRNREFEKGRGPREENMSRQLPINQRIAKAKEHLHQLEIEKSQLEIMALGLDGSQNGSQKRYS
jgi:hypothetical protein